MGIERRERERETEWRGPFRVPPAGFLLSASLPFAADVAAAAAAAAAAVGERVAVGIVSVVGFPRELESWDGWWDLIVAGFHSVFGLAVVLG